MTKIAVIIPCYKVSKYILNVLHAIGPEVYKIYVVDDDCPEHSGEVVKKNCFDPRVIVLNHTINQGVGAAVITGYDAAIKDNIDIMVKIDGDGQMDPQQLHRLILPIINGLADYTKGNRFFDLDHLQKMPMIRMMGNAILSFINKLSSGYWEIFDPTNGYTAIHAQVAKRLPFHKISKRYFFESDMLFRLNTLRAVVMDIPMEAFYGEEKSNMKITSLVGEFFYKHIRNFWKRIFYNYYLRNMSIASIELPLGIGLMMFGFIFGSYQWFTHADIGIISSPGTVMLSALPIILGLQLILAFLGHDSRMAGTLPLHVLILRHSHKPTISAKAGNGINV